MIPCHSASIKLSNSQLHLLKSATKNATHLTLRLSPNMVGTSETNFLHNLLITDR